MRAIFYDLVVFDHHIVILQTTSPCYFKDYTFRHIVAQTIDYLSLQDNFTHWARHTVATQVIIAQNNK